MMQGMCNQPEIGIPCGASVLSRTRRNAGRSALTLTATQPSSSSSHESIAQQHTLVHGNIAQMALISVMSVIGFFLAVRAQPHQLTLTVNTTMGWSVHYQSRLIEMEIRTEMNRSALMWFGVGFSDYGEPAPSDLCMVWMDWKGKLSMQDTWVDSRGIVSVDKKQDCRDFKFTWRDNDTLVVYFTRAFDTCDDADYIIEGGTTHVVWIRGMGPLFSLQGLDIKSAAESIFQRTTLLYNEQEPPKHSSDTWILEIRANNTRVPNVETTYWCTIIKLPDKLQKKNHVIQYERVIENVDLVHHMEVFHCDTGAEEEMPSFEGPCKGPERPEKTQVCSKVVAAWAMGAPPFVYPEDAGLPIGGQDYNPYVMLEIHYHNPQKLAGEVDNTGFKLYLTPTLRQYDAGIMELGLEYNHKMAIPPKQERFILRGFCVSECTSVGLPAKGISVFGSQLHTHLTGVAANTKHVRNGVELPELNRDNHFSQHFQEIRRLRHIVNILPGDALVTTCEYKTVDKKEVTLTGFGIHDEMCVNYIHYYPSSNLEVCKSSIPDADVMQYFDFMAKWEGQDTTGHKGISDKYKAIEWNPKRVADLQALYLTNPISMQCNQSSGQRFPGGWEGLPTTEILLPLPVPERHCGIIDEN